MFFPDRASSTDSLLRHKTIGANLRGRMRGCMTRRAATRFCCNERGELPRKPTDISSGATAGCSPPLESGGWMAACAGRCSKILSPCAEAVLYPDDLPR
jgi:hypothetical protein